MPARAISAATASATASLAQHTPATFAAPPSAATAAATSRTASSGRVRSRSQPILTRPSSTACRARFTVAAYGSVAGPLRSSTGPAPFKAPSRASACSRPTRAGSVAT
nr:hypothetical protein [Microbispora sp. GKU 823]